MTTMNRPLLQEYVLKLVVQFTRKKTNGGPLCTAVVACGRDRETTRRETKRVSLLRRGQSLEVEAEVETWTYDGSALAWAADGPADRTDDPSCLLLEPTSPRPLARAFSLVRRGRPPGYRTSRPTAGGSATG